MKKLYLIGIALMVLAGLFTSCNNRIEPEGPDTPVEEEYVQVRFTTADDPATTAATRAVWDDTNGSGNLMFKWEEDLLAKELVVAISNDDMFLNSIDEMAEASNWYSYVTIEPEESTDGTPNRANFVTFSRYLSSEIESATRIFAVAPITGDNRVFAEGYNFSAYLEMPNEFTQTASQNPEFLRDYMMMYGIGDMQNSTASIYFNHIPATFRFIITNKRPGSAAIQSITMKVDDDVTPIGSAQVEVSAMADSPSMDLSYTDEHNTITTHINADVTKGGVYTAYAMALPLPSNSSEDLSCDAFRGKNIQFSIVTAENEHLAFTLSGDQIASANFKYWDDIYNWVGGKSYTIRMKLDDILYFESVTVTDWTQEEIQGGEAEEDEWRNGINIYTGEYQPATLNAEGVYEIGNTGNLMWFNQLATASDVDNAALNAVLTADVDLEGFKWAALGRSSDKPYVGTFDGQGHTISNLSRNAHSNEGSRESFVYYLGGEGVIKNVTFDNADVFCQGHASANASAVVALRSAGTISCCVVSNARVQLGNYEYLSGIAGVNNGTIENCAVINTSLTRRFGHSHPSAPITHNNLGTVCNCFAYGCTQSANNAANGGIVVSCSTAPANSYYYTTSSVSDAYGTAKTPEEFASATMAELLNGDQENGPWEYVTGNDYLTLKK